MLNVLKDYSRRGPNDELATPVEALNPILPYLPPGTAWDNAPGSGRLILLLRAAGIEAVGVPGDGLFNTPPPFDVLVTNPPYSKKSQFLQRAVKLGKPWAMLLPVTTLGVAKCQKWLGDVDILFLRRRIDFTGGKAPWFAVCWISWGMLPERIMFEGRTKG